MTIMEACGEALKLIATLDPAMMQIILLSLKVSGSAVLLAAFLGVPLGALLGLMPQQKISWLTKIIYTLMGLPPVVAGLVIYLLLSSQGPLGALGLLFTPAAMIIAQTVIAFPIITGLTLTGVRGKEREIRETAVSLGANSWQVTWTVIKEARLSITGAVVAGFGRVIAEVGAVMIVGANIEGYTRVMTTAIVLETRKGNFEMALGLGLVLLLIAFVFNIFLYRLQGGV